MTAIGKLLALLLLPIGLVMMMWATGVYAQRPVWFAKTPEGGYDKGAEPLTFEQLKADADALNRAAGVAHDVWGANLKALEDAENLRAARLRAYAQREQWARKGNPKDLIDPANPRSGKGFYAPVADPDTRLYDLALDAAGKPKGAPVRGSDNQPLPGLDQLSSSVSKDLDEMQALTADIVKQREAFKVRTAEVLATEQRLLKMNVIRTSVQSELFYLSAVEIGVYETRETVIRRERQLRARLKGLGVYDP